jgi:alpha-N-arabinofuranosidase
MKKTVAIALLMLSLKIFLPAQSNIIIDVTKEKAPISKYIYGQFIEHLGKSVYSGLWAEMILDRKFCYPITEKYDPWGIGEPDSWWGGSQFPYLKGSPWKIVGTPGTVSMDSISPYCGNYAALVKPAGDGIPTGISHDALSLVEGKAYSGRIILSGISSALPIVVSVVVDNITISEINLTEVDTTYKIFPISFTSSVNTDSATLNITSTGGGWFSIGSISLMPADNIDGWRRDLVTLLKELDSPIYRWPGGNFVSGYNWRDGIGDIDKRAPRKNPAWTGIEPNDVGIHEFMNLMSILNSDPFIAINRADPRRRRRPRDRCTGQGPVSRRRRCAAPGFLALSIQFRGETVAAATCLEQTAVADVLVKQLL